MEVLIAYCLSWEARHKQSTIISLMSVKMNSTPCCIDAELSERYLISARKPHPLSPLTTINCFNDIHSALMRRLWFNRWVGVVCH